MRELAAPAAVAAALALISACGAGTVELPPGETDATFELGEVAAGAYVRDEQLAAAVPARGHTVTVIADRTDGTARILRVEHDRGGRVFASRLLDETAGDEAAGAADGFAQSSQALSPGACRDDAFNTEGHHWTGSFRWWLRASTVPDGLSRDRAETALREAATNITRSRNDCGLDDRVSATQSYAGRTATPTDIDSDSGSIACGGYDDKNVVAFGTLPPGTLGVACVWTLGDEIVAGDVKLNKAGYRWYATNSAPSGCANRFSVEAVATHEFGHVFGLGHVSERAHANLTMSTKLGPCTGSASTLGLGDVRALRQLY